MFRRGLLAWSLFCFIHPLVQHGALGSHPQVEKRAGTGPLFHTRPCPLSGPQGLGGGEDTEVIGV